MAIVKGPFEIHWGANVLTDVESVDLSFEQESNDYTTVDGRTITVKGAISASATITLLASDVDSLTAILPQFTKGEGTTMSSGEVIPTGKKALDILAGDCTAEEEKYDLDIISCGTPAEVLRIKSCTTSISNVDLENNQVRTVEITFTGEPGVNTDQKPIAAIQMFDDTTIPLSA